MRKTLLFFILFFFTDVGISLAGDVWVTSYSPNRVVQITTDGKLVQSHRVGGCPFGVAVDLEGNVWISLGCADAVTKLSPRGKVLGIYSVGSLPMGIAIDRDGKVWVAHGGARYVCKLSSEGKILGTFNIEGSARGIAADKFGNIWITQFSSEYVTKLDSEGNLLGTYQVGKCPYGIAADAEGNLWVVNAFSNSLSKLNQKGMVIGNFKVGDNPRGVAIDKEGFIWVTNKIGNSLSKLSPEGELAGTFALEDWPFGISVDFKGNLWVTNRGVDRITRLNSSGEILGSVKVGPKPYSFGDATGFALANFTMAGNSSATSFPPGIEEGFRRVERLYDFLQRLPQGEILAPDESYIASSRFTASMDIPRMVLYQHPPSSVMFREVPIYEGAMLEFGISLMREAWEAEGDGVWFTIYLLADEKTGRQIFSRYIDPKSIPEERKWFDYAIDLKEYVGSRVDLIFVTSPGPKGSFINDWAGWSYPHILSHGRREKTERERLFDNVILITVDSLRADFLGCYGNPEVSTPVIDNFARRGLLFEYCFAQSVNTLSSHASILSSLYPKDHGIYDHSTIMPEGVLTLAEVFKENGFTTAAAVSSSLLNPGMGFEQGYDYFYPSPPVYPYQRDSSETNREVFSWLDGHHRESFFLWVHYFDTHGPYAPPPPYDSLYYKGDHRNPSNRSMDVVLGSKNPLQFLNKKWYQGITDIEYVVAQYKGEVSYLDHQIGRLIKKLEALGLREKTLLVFTADHGESLKEHGIYFAHMGLYDQSTRVPLIFAGLPPARISSLAETIDIYSTILDIMRIEIPPNLRGKSLLPFVGLSPDNVSSSLTEHTGGTQVSIRTQKYKFIKHLKDFSLYPGYPYSKGRMELYNIEDDPSELMDITTKHPDIVRIFDKLLDGWLADRLGKEKPRTIESEEHKKMLRSLGYIQ